MSCDASLVHCRWACCSHRIVCGDLRVDFRRNHLESDDRLGFREVIAAPVVGKSARRLVINVPSAELICALPNCPYRVASTGQLERTGLKGQVIRDDRKRVENIAKAAAAYYGRIRRSVSISWDALGGAGLALGDFVTTLGDTLETNSVLTAMQYDFVNGSTQATTEFAELDTDLFSGNLI